MGRRKTRKSKAVRAVAMPRAKQAAGKPVGIISNGNESDSSSAGEIAHNAGKRQQTPAEDGDDDDEDDNDEAADGAYRVEKILSHTIRRGRVWYEVAWVGYDAPSWEPVQNLDGCPEILENFHKEIGGTPVPDQKKKKPGRPPRDAETTAGTKRKISATQSKASNAQPTKKQATGRGRGKSQGRVSEFLTEDGTKYGLPSGNWDGLGLLQVLDVMEVVDPNSKGKGRVLQARTRWNQDYDNRIFVLPNSTLHYSAPRTLLEYYEARITFTSREQPTIKTGDPTEAGSADGDMDLDARAKSESAAPGVDMDDDIDEVGIKDVASG